MKQRGIRPNGMGLTLGSFAAVAVLALSGQPAYAGTTAATIDEPVIGPGSTMHATVSGCAVPDSKPWLLAPFARADDQSWTKSGSTWKGTVPVHQWGTATLANAANKPAGAAKTDVSIVCAGNAPKTVPVDWDPLHKPAKDDPSASPSTSASPTPSSTPSKPAMKPQATVTPTSFDAGDTLTITVKKCEATDPSVKSDLFDRVKWKHSGTTHIAKALTKKKLRDGYYTIKVVCGEYATKFKVKYGASGSANNKGGKPTNNPGGQTTKIPYGAPETGGGSAAATAR